MMDTYSARWLPKVAPDFEDLLDSFYPIGNAAGSFSAWETSQHLASPAIICVSVCVRMGPD